MNETPEWTEYFAPLEKLINEIRAKYADNRKVLEEANNAQWEVDMFKKNPELNSSVYFVIKKSS